MQISTVAVKWNYFLVELEAYSCGELRRWLDSA
jgi:hypothetical protein